MKNQPAFGLANLAQRGPVLLGAFVLTAALAAGLAAQETSPQAVVGAPSSAIVAAPMTGLPAGVPSNGIVSLPGNGPPGGAPSNAIASLPRNGLPASAAPSAIVSLPRNALPAGAVPGAIVSLPRNGLPGGAASSGLMGSPAIGLPGGAPASAIVGTPYNKFPPDHPPGPSRLHRRRSRSGHQLQSRIGKVHHHDRPSKKSRHSPDQQSSGADQPACGPVRCCRGADQHSGPASRQDRVHQLVSSSLRVAAQAAALESSTSRCSRQKRDQDS